MAHDSWEEDQTAEEFADKDPDDPGYVQTAGGSIFFTDDNRFSKTKDINVPFYIFQEHIYKQDFPYTDDFFRYPSNEFNKVFAQGSLGFAVSAFRNDGKDIDNQYETYLKGAGFSDIYAFGYDKETAVDTLSGVIAHKKIDDFTVVACAPCGQGYSKEWGSNLLVGDASRHVGFNNAARIFEREIVNYINRCGISGKTKVWLSGFSRASAVSNITAADLIDSGRYDDVYAYLFGVPNTTRDPGSYEGIFNICGQYDPVTSIPLHSWGFERYGNDIYTPAQESDVYYSKMKNEASVMSEKIADEILRNNPETNHQMHMIQEFLGELFSTSKEYVDKMQTEAMKIWTEPNQDQIFEVLIQLMSSLEDLDAREEYSRDIFIDYLSYIVSEHLQGNKRQIEEGSWDANASIPENILREHNPLTYMCWAFSDNVSPELYGSSNVTRLFSINGKADVEVYQSDVFVGSIDKYGNTVKAADLLEQSAVDVPVVFMMRRGNETRVSLPTDTKFTIYISTDTRENLLYYDTLYAAGVQTGANQYCFITLLEPGQYHVSAEKMLGLTELRADSGKIIGNYREDLEYSTLIGMAMESKNTFHITPEFIVQSMFYSLIGFALLIVICVAVAIAHAIGKRRKQKEYSPLWVIVPHVILIIFFAIVTQFFTFNLYTIGIVKTVFSTLAIFFVFLLALRAFIRNKGKFTGIVAGGVLILVVLTFLFYKDSFFADYSLLEMIIYSVCMIALTVLAVLGFHRKNMADNDGGTEYNIAQSDNAAQSESLE